MLNGLTARCWASLPYFPGIRQGTPGCISSWIPHIYDANFDKSQCKVLVSSETEYFLQWVLFIELYEFSKPCESFCLRPSIFWENCIKLTFLGCPPKCYHRDIASSSGRIYLNLKLPFKLILRSFEVVFWCLEWECCPSWKIDRNSFKSTNIHTMALRYKIHWVSKETSLL